MNKKDMKIAIKKAFLKTGKSITVNCNGIKYTIHQEKVNNVWKGIVYGGDFNGTALNGNVIERMIETDESGLI